MWGHLHDFFSPKTFNGCIPAVKMKTVTFKSMQNKKQPGGTKGDIGFSYFMTLVKQ